MQCFGLRFCQYYESDRLMYIQYLVMSATITEHMPAACKRCMLFFFCLVYQATYLDSPPIILMILTSPRNTFLQRHGPIGAPWFCVRARFIVANRAPRCMLLHITLHIHAYMHTYSHTCIPTRERALPQQPGTSSSGPAHVPFRARDVTTGH